MPPSEKMTILTTKIRVPSDLKEAFIDWQTKLNAIIAAFPGFISLEILSPHETTQHVWIIIERFSNPESLSRWQISQECKSLMEELKKMLRDERSIDVQAISSQSHEHKEVTELLVTQVTPGMEQAYLKWIAKIHQMEAKFPGFRGVYVESPNNRKGGNWITLLKFDNAENLDHWLISPERAKMLRESDFLFTSLESHSVLSPYVGWFASLEKKGETPPPVWKQTMLILLVLFPIVMLELKYLSPLTGDLNKSVANFIGNAISVTLLAWPMVPLAIRCLSWWLSPKKNTLTNSLLGTGLVCLLYLIEIALFWNFL